MIDMSYNQINPLLLFIKLSLVGAQSLIYENA